MDFLGGTYLSQVMAGSPKGARSEWAKKMEWNSVPGAKGVQLPEILGELADETLSPIEGLIKVWCFTVSLKGKLAIIHVVES